jgi:hypothetical protein
MWAGQFGEELSPAMTERLQMNQNWHYTVRRGLGREQYELR